MTDYPCTTGPSMAEDFANQAASELAFAKAMGWDDWTWEEETGGGIVRGWHVQWNPDHHVGLFVYDDDDDDARWVLVTGVMPQFRVHGWITVGEAKQRGFRIGEG